MTNDHAGEMFKVAGFFNQAIRQIAGLQEPDKVQLLDFGCGAGSLMTAFSTLGYAAQGCDVALYGDAAPGAAARQQITQSPYRFPFEDNRFDIVVSTSVLEHAQNPNEYMTEISRVLKPGGYAMHLFPGKWYLPSEPHMYVPLANFFWPNCPLWWLKLWALLGRRSEHQKDWDWREVAAANLAYCQQGLCYLTTAEYNTLSRRYFKESRWPMDFYLANAYGSFARIARKLPFQSAWGWISREFRMGFLVQRK
jgi:SAM-dependent methyltransferase